MLSVTRAEMRKLLTVRSTYILSGLALIIVGLISFWALGIKGTPHNSSLLMESVEVSGIVSLFVAIIAILLITHEYRYNTIMYTLTATNSRSKVLIAKLMVITAFATIFTSVAALMAIGLTWAGISIGPGGMVVQEFYYWDTIWRSLFGSLAYVWAGLLFGVLLRHVVGALVVFLIVPSTIEELLTLLLKENSKYLPFTALESVQSGALMAPSKAALIFTAYLAGGWIVAWLLFLRRDAN